MGLVVCGISFNPLSHLIRLLIDETIEVQSQLDLVQGRGEAETHACGLPSNLLLSMSLAEALEVLSLGNCSQLSSGHCPGPQGSQQPS